MSLLTRLRDRLAPADDDPGYETYMQRLTAPYGDDGDPNDHDDPTGYDADEQDHDDD